MNPIIEQLQQRSSHPAAALADPAPSDEQLAQLIACAISAPDHGKLRPWRFTSFRGPARERLGAAMAQAAVAADPALDAAGRRAIAAKMLRAPLVIACAVALRRDVAKVPPHEQILSAGAAIAQLQMAAQALNFGSIWTTGPHADSAAVKALLGRANDDLVAGFLHLGSRTAPSPHKSRPAPGDHWRVG